MARSQRRDDEDALDPVEAADQPTDAEEDDLDGFTDVDAEESEEGEEDELDTSSVELDFDEDAEDPALPEAEGDEDDEDDEAALPLLLPDEDLAAVVAETEDDDEDEEDALKEGEFVCRSCFMAKRESALADPEAMLCRDCA